MCIDVVGTDGCLVFVVSFCHHTLQKPPRHYCPHCGGCEKHSKFHPRTKDVDPLDVVGHFVEVCWCDRHSSGISGRFGISGNLNSDVTSSMFGISGLGMPWTFSNRSGLVTRSPRILLKFDD